MTDAALARVRAAKRTALLRFKALGLDAAIGITRIGEDYALKVNVAAPIPDDVDLPSEIGGVPVHVEVIGPLRPR